MAQKLFDPPRIIPLHDHTVDDRDRQGHEAPMDQFVEGGRVGRHVLLGEWDTVLRKKLFRPLAGESAGTAIDDNVLWHQDLSVLSTTSMLVHRFENHKDVATHPLAVSADMTLRYLLPRQAKSPKLKIETDLGGRIRLRRSLFACSQHGGYRCHWNVKKSSKSSSKRK